MVIQRCVFLPQLDHQIESFQCDAVAFRHFLATKKFGIAHQATRPDSKNQAAIAELIKLGNFRCDHNWVVIRKINNAGREAN